WQGTRLVVPNDASLREALLTEAYSSPFLVHSGSTKMYHDLKQHFWWSGMKGDVAMFVSKCLICQRVKIEHQRASATVSDRDPRFASRFWKGLQKGWGTRLRFSTAFHPQTDGQIVVAKEKLKEARTRQKSYADKHRKSLEFQPGDHVFLKVSPARGVRRFGIKGKLSPRFIRPFEILDRVGEVSYQLALPPQLSHVHNVFHVSLLRGYKYHP
nr:hypothetical protein [Tanacetum cinerariifolium]